GPQRCGRSAPDPGPGLSPSGRLAAAVCLGAVGSLGFCSNLLVPPLFWRYRALRSPVNLLLLNIALGDLPARAPGTPLGLAAPPPGGRPRLARLPTSPNTNVCFDAGIISLISLAVLSYEHYCTMTGMTEPPPPLFGWSSYRPQEAGTMCSVNWHSKDTNNLSYIICLFIFCLVIPFVIIVYPYGKLLCAIRQVSSINKGMGRTREQRILFMVVVMVICFLLCWLPYATLACIAMFGKPGLSPLLPASSHPSLPKAAQSTTPSSIYF
uniref:G-protein coupled receptors family 1 profile domain-containing protein n=1 Tax=Accipiter nisus TaxID=211598 RepID=A0A8B9M5X1_9AVES